MRAYIFTADAGVIIAARDVVHRRIEVVEVAGDAARRPWFEQVVDAEREAEAGRPRTSASSAAACRCRTSRFITLPSDLLAASKRSGRSGSRRNGRQIPIEDADRLPLREALRRAALLGPFAADDLRSAGNRDDHVIVAQERVVPGEAEAADARLRRAVRDVEVPTLGLDRRRCSPACRRPASSCR